MSEELEDLGKPSPITVWAVPRAESSTNLVQEEAGPEGRTHGLAFTSWLSNHVSSEKLFLL